VFGIAIDASGDLAGVQKTAVAWSRGACADVGGLAQGTLPIKVFNIALAPLDGLNTTAHSNLTTTAATNRTLPSASRRAANPWHRRRGWASKRATCSYIRVESGDGCASLAVKCGISGAAFTTYNPGATFCSTLQPGDYVCCSAGDRYVEPTPDPP